MVKTTLNFITVLIILGGSVQQGFGQQDTTSNWNWYLERGLSGTYSSISVPQSDSTHDSYQLSFGPQFGGAIVLKLSDEWGATASVHGLARRFVLRSPVSLGWRASVGGERYLTKWTVGGEGTYQFTEIMGYAAGVRVFGFYLGFSESWQFGFGVDYQRHLVNVADVSVNSFGVLLLARQKFSF